MTRVSGKRREGPPRRYRLDELERLEETRIGYIRDAYLRGELNAYEMEEKIGAEMLSMLPHKERALPPFRPPRSFPKTAARARTVRK